MRKCSEHAVDCKCLTDKMPNLRLNRMLLETPMPDLYIPRTPKDLSLKIQMRNECPNCFDEHPEDVECHPFRRKHPMTECRVCHEILCKCQGVAVCCMCGLLKTCFCSTIKKSSTVANDK